MTEWIGADEVSGKPRSALHPNVRALRGARFAGRRIVILGLGRQGIALAQYLTRAGAQVVVSDAQPAEKLTASLEALRKLPIEYVLGGHPLSLLEGTDLLCLSGGVDAQMPLAQEALRRGISLSNDSQILLELCPTDAFTVGITGSAGKTTTTTLVGRMCQAWCDISPIPHHTFVGGNIGNPLITQVDDIQAGDLVVLELSSFQLEIMTRSPRIAAVLNVSPNHLDRHGTMDAYIAAKSHILQHQAADGVAILSWDNATTRALATRTPGWVAYFSDTEAVPQGVFIRGGNMVWRWDDVEQVLAPLSLIELRGQHNVLNVLAASAIAAATLYLNGAEPTAIAKAVQTGLQGFTGVAHRLELVHERNGVKWYNDSIASAPERVMAALHSFSEPIVLLLGGRDKKLPWGELAALVRQRVKYAVLFGEAGPLIQEALEAAGVRHLARYATLAEAVLAAAQQASAGDIVLLSPGCTSFDEFKDFAERGEKFSQLVKSG